MILKIKAMGYRSDEIYATIWAGDEQAGRLVFKPAEWDAFIAALRSGAPNAGITLNIEEDIDDDLAARSENACEKDECDGCEFGTEEGCRTIHCPYIPDFT